MPSLTENRVSPASTAAFVRLLLLVSLPLYFLDQGTKALVVREITEPVVVIPRWFELVSVTNTGAAWGILKDSNALFIGFSAIAVIALIVLYRQRAFDQPLPRAGFFLLLPGIFGNVTDRLLRGHVVDFLLFDLHLPGAHPWPSFNVADSCICLAVVAFLLGSWQDLRRPETNR